MMVCGFSACGKTYTEISPEEFERQMTGLNYQVSAESEFTDSQLQDVVSACPADGAYEILLLIFSSDDACQQFFREREERIRAQKPDISANLTLDFNGRGYYSLTTFDSFECLSRINNTCIVISTEKKYKKEIQEAVALLGY
jgi:hypothetical protein